LDNKVIDIDARL